MPEPRHLRNAPITEALVDLRAVPTADLKSSEIRDALRKTLADRFPKHVERRAFSAEVTVQPGGGPSMPKASEAFHGHFFESPDGRDIVQLRVDGFTYNRLAPYQSGDSLLETAMEMWTTYSRFAKPESVTRVALRYINGFEVGRNEAGRFLSCPPRALQGTPGDIQSFISRVETLDAKSGHRVITTVASAPGIQPVENLVLDIDAFMLGEFGTEVGELRPLLDGLRKLKNTVFFGNISDEAVARFS